MKTRLKFESPYSEWFFFLFMSRVNDLQIWMEMSRYFQFLVVILLVPYFDSFDSYTRKMEFNLEFVDKTMHFLRWTSNGEFFGKVNNEKERLRKIVQVLWIFIMFQQNAYFLWFRFRTISPAWGYAHSTLFNVFNRTTSFPFCKWVETPGYLTRILCRSSTLRVENIPTRK